jgi:hypothetical protein
MSIHKFHHGIPAGIFFLHEFHLIEMQLETAMSLRNYGNPIENLYQ